MNYVTDRLALRASPKQNGGKGADLVAAFDTLCPWTMIAWSPAAKMRGRHGRTLVPLDEPKPFAGAGGGRFRAEHRQIMHACFEGVWMPLDAWVIPDGLIGFDLIVGNDWMEHYAIGVFPKESRIQVDPERLRRMFYVGGTYWEPRSRRKRWPRRS